MAEPTKRKYPIDYTRPWWLCDFKCYECEILEDCKEINPHRQFEPPTENNEIQK